MGVEIRRKSQTGCNLCGTARLRVTPAATRRTRCGTSALFERYAQVGGEPQRDGRQRLIQLQRVRPHVQPHVGGGANGAVADHRQPARGFPRERLGQPAVPYDLGVHVRGAGGHHVDDYDRHALRQVAEALGGERPSLGLTVLVRRADQFDGRRQLPPPGVAVDQHLERVRVGDLDHTRERRGGQVNRFRLFNLSTDTTTRLRFNAFGQLPRVQPSRDRHGPTEREPRPPLPRGHRRVKVVEQWHGRFSRDGTPRYQTSSPFTSPHTPSETGRRSDRPAAT